MVSWFDRPVPVRLSAGLTFQVGDPKRAARLLLGELKAEPDTRKHRAARLALIKALETAGDQKRLLAARKAFEAAVDEAGALGSAPNNTERQK